MFKNCFVNTKKHFLVNVTFWVHQGRKHGTVIKFTKRTLELLPLDSMSHFNMWLSDNVITSVLSPDGCHRILE